MKAYSRWIAPVLFAVVLSTVSRAEEAKPPASPAPEESEGKLARLFIEVSDWIAEPGGLTYVPATVNDPSQTFGTTTLHMPLGDENRARFRVGYLLRGNIGEFVLTWYSHDQKEELGQYSPGSFVFGEAPVHPAGAGIFDDGMADGILVDTRTRLRDLRLDFYRIGYQSPRITVRWFVGYRRVEHNRSLLGTYYSLVPVYNGVPIPPLIAPLGVPGPLAPIPDVASLESKFNGRGADAGAELTFPLNRHLYIESGFSLAVLDGTLQTSYSSLAHVYALANTDGSIDHYLSPPFSEFEQTNAQGTPLIGFIRQLSVPIGIRTDDSASAQVLESYLGIRWKAWRGLEAFGGYRNARYTGVGADVRPNLNTADTTRVDHAAIYQGFYLGASYKF
jgi:hypothetical protein